MKCIGTLGPVFKLDHSYKSRFSKEYKILLLRRVWAGLIQMHLSCVKSGHILDAEE